MALAKKPAEIVAESKSALLAKHESWERAAVSDVAEILNGYAFKSDRFTSEKGTPLIRIRDVGKDRTNTYFDGEYDDAYLVKNGDLLVGMDGDFRCSIWRGEDALLNQRVCKITLKTDAYDFGFLSYALQPYLDAIHAETSAVTVKHLSSKSISEIPLPLPPVEQQKRIVAKIEELFSHVDAGIAFLVKARQQLKQYRQSILKAAVTGEFTKQWREENKDKLEPASQLLERILQERRQKWEAQQLEQLKAKGKVPKDDGWKGKYKEPLGFNYDGELPELPESWTWASPEQLASTDKYALSIGPFGSNLKVPDYRSSGVPLVFVRNIRRHEYGLLGGKFVTSEKAKELNAHAISGGDVLITKMGEPPGDASIYPADSPDAIITADCIKWRFSQLIKSPQLYVHAINSWLIKEQIVERTKGVAQKKISLGTFKSIAFPLAPLAEQSVILQKIENKISSIDRLEKVLVLQLLRAEKNKQSILASAFSGDLVEVLDSDGSPQELLEEIRRLHVLNATKEKLTNKKRPSKKKAGLMSKKKIIDVLKVSEQALSPEKLFDLIGADGSSPDEVEAFYIELKETLADKHVAIEPVLDVNVKKGDLISYKVEA